MPGRFTRLEFDEHERARDAKHLQSLEGTPLRDAQHYSTLAVESAQLGRFENALQMYTRCVREDRTMIPAWVGQVQMLVQLGEYAEARLWCDKALELFRDNGDLLAAKSQACLRQGDVAAALALTDASLRSPGMSPWRWEVRGETLLAKGESLFRPCFQKALAESVADWFDRIVIARILLFHDHAVAALDYAQQAIAMRANHPYNWLVLGECQESLGWTQQAETSFLRCLELSPRLDEAQQAIETLRTRSMVSRIGRRIGGWFRR